MIAPALLRLLAVAVACFGFTGVGRAETFNATYNSASDVPIVTPSFTASGNTVQFTLNFAPSTGTRLTVVRNTGLDFIQGRFDNLAHGQAVAIIHGGTQYWFTANYYGNSGRDLVLQWMNARPFAWGAGADGKLGRGTTADSAVPVPVRIHDALWGKYPSSGAAGSGHSLGLCADGTLVSWGLNTNGQLGVNSTASSSVPLAVSGGVLSGKTVVAVSAGVGHSLALCSDGKVAAWGLNASGQVGNGTTMTPQLTPVNVSTSGVLSGKTVVAVSSGAYHNLALSSEGKVFSWGLNTSGQLGNNSTTQSSSPVAITGGVLAGKTVVAIAAGGYHSLALCSDGTLAAWGKNDNGQLGDSSTTQRNLPVAVTATSGALLGKALNMIAAGGSHSLALCSDGSLASWGLNTNGQLGNGNNSQSNLPVTVSRSGVLNGRTVFMISAGATHSIAQCLDGKAALWGSGANGRLGNNSSMDSNVPVLADDTGLEPEWIFSPVSGFSGVVSGPSASHSLALVASPENDLSHCGFHKQISHVQTSFADPYADPDSPFSFHAYANPGSMGGLLDSSSITPPAGGTGIADFENGSFGLQIYRIFRSKADLDAAYPSGTYLMSLRTTTPNSYQVALSLGGDQYPAVPKITSVTNATWIDGILKITNPALDTVITWSNPGGADTWFQIDNTSVSSPASNPSTSFTIPGGALATDSFYRGVVQLMTHSGQTFVPGASGAQADCHFNTQVRFQIQVGSPSGGDGAMYLVMKNHNQVQSSNNDPADSPNPLPDADLAPYAFSVEAPSAGSVTGPAGTYPLGLHPDGDGPGYEYMGPPAASAAALNSGYPNGTYTLSGGASVNLPADAYPASAKVLTVNGVAPVWTDDGHLALDPTVDNTITWSAVSVPDFSTQGHQSIYFESYRDFNFVNIEEERGAFTADPAAPALTALTIPKNTMTPTYTYQGYIGYASAVSVSEPSPGVYALGIFETANHFMAVALKPQTITFGAISSKVFPGPSFLPGATSSSGLPVSYEVVSGPATVSGNTVTLVGTGTVVIRASQPGTGMYASATSVTQSFTVAYSSKLAEFRATNGLASDGSQDLLTPAGDGVPNLLKYAFNMVGTGTGQATPLSKPNVQIVGPSGNAGLPRQGADSGKLTITYIRRKSASSPGVSYAVEFSTSMGPASWGVNPSATESVTSIDSNFERVTVTDNITYSKRFARVKVVGD